MQIDTQTLSYKWREALAFQVILLANFRQKKTEPSSSCDPQHLTIILLLKIKPIDRLLWEINRASAEVRDFGRRCLNNMFSTPSDMS